MAASSALHAARSAPAAEVFNKPQGGKRKSAELLTQQANAAGAGGNLADAEGLYRKAIKTDTGYLPAFYHLGNLLRSAGRLADALACYDLGARIAPKDPEIHFGRGITLNAMARYAHAINAFELTAKLAPRALEPLLNKGVALARCGQYEKAIKIWSDLLAQQPSLSIARYYRAMTYLTLGRNSEGFLDHEARLDLPGVVPHDLLVGKQKWDGAALNGKTLLIYPEQGMGDMIQFLRYAPACKQLGARTMVVCHAPLAPLFDGVDGIDVVVPDDGRPLPEDFDAYIALMSLPQVLGERRVPEPLALHVPIQPLPAIADAPGLKVGVCWQGSRAHERDAERSIPQALFWQGLNDIEHVSFFSLQIDEAPIANAVSLAPFIHDFRDTANLVQQLDLVITVDTSVAHLSATLGIPTWILVSLSPDWRWGLEQATTPWYPSVRLFRQPEAGNWVAALDQIKQALREHGQCNGRLGRR